MKMIYVSGDEYASLEFEQRHVGQSISEFIKNFFDENKTEIAYSFLTDRNTEIIVDCELFNFGEIDPKFIQFVRKTVQDYDDSKHSNFYFEDQIL